MSTEEDETQRYSCDTQDEQEASWGPAPVSHLSGSGADEPDSLVVGYGSLVPRWDVVNEPGRKLSCYAKKETFPSEQDALFAAASFEDAANAWNKVGHGLSIVLTQDKAAANFFLVYQKSNPGSGTLARAFFPHEMGQDVIVFSFAFQENNKSIMKNVFMHELGHVLGLRHEFAIIGDQKKNLDPERNGAVQFMEENYYSIMSYNFPPKLQQSDKTGLVAFYKLTNGFMIDGSPVTDYMPVVRT